MATEEHIPARRHGQRRILRQILLTLGLVSLISLGYGLRDILADEPPTGSSANLVSIVSSDNAIQLPALQTTAAQASSRPIVQTAIAMPALQAQASSRPIVQTAITMPEFNAASLRNTEPIVQVAIAMPDLSAANLLSTQPIVKVAIAVPELGTASLLSSQPILGTSNTIQVPQLAASSVQSILGVGNDIVQPVLGSELELPSSSSTNVIEATGLPTTGSGSSLAPGTTPTILILVLLALALSAAGLAIRVHRQIVTAPNLVQRR